MSAFIGPIHKWLYNKIIFQEQITDLILEISEKKGINNIRKNADELFGTVPKEDMESIIDKNNIHGWLQDKISIAEKRFAYVVTTIELFNSDIMDIVLFTVKSFGKEFSDLKDSDAEGIYNFLEEVLLNGMPCDRVNTLIEKNEDVVLWKQNVDIHQPFWNIENGNVENYYKIRNTFIEGVLSGTDFLFEEENSMYSIRRKLCTE